MRLGFCLDGDAIVRLVGKPAGQPEGGADGLMHSHYDILGVKESADRRAIRAAYLKKIKAAHPDRRSGKNSKEQAAAINFAYFTLRDSRRRLAYDFDLTRARTGSKAASEPAVAPWEPRVIAPRPLGRSPPPLQSRKAIASGAIVGVAIVALLLVIANIDSAAHRPSPSLAETDSAVPLTAARSPWVDREMVDRAIDNLAWIQRYGHATDIVRYSRHCLEELHTTPSDLLLDHCVAFDLAARALALDARRASRDTVPPGLSGKYGPIMRTFSLGDAEASARLREIRIAALAAVAARAAPKRDMVPAAGLPR